MHKQTGDHQIEPTPRRRWRRWTLLAFVICVLGLIGAELFARFGLGLGDPPLSMAHPTIEYLFRPARTYHRFHNKIHYNVYSMRSDDFPPTKQNPNELRIMMLGDSVINGGNLTDQSELASERLKRLLSKKLNRPVVVGNISAGSWGPGNLDAYVAQYGMFDADLAIIVLNSKDWDDLRTFKPIVGVDPSYPSKTPAFALQEAISRYLPRYLPSFSSDDDSPAKGKTPSPHAQQSPQSAQASAANKTQAQSNTGQALRSLIKRIQKREIPILLAQHPAQSELDGNWKPGHARFGTLAQQMHIPVIQLAPTFRQAVKTGKQPYRDPIHPNALGQRLIAERLLEMVPKKVH